MMHMRDNLSCSKSTRSDFSNGAVVIWSQKNDLDRYGSFKHGILFAESVDNLVRLCRNVAAKLTKGFGAYLRCFRIRRSATQSSRP